MFHTFLKPILVSVYIVFFTLSVLSFCLLCCI